MGYVQLAQGMLQSPQMPPPEALLTNLINELSTSTSLSASHKVVPVLDDYHLIEAQPVHQALTFLLEHLPPQLCIALTTRVDPPLPLARLRARGQLTEIRATDLRLTQAETASFLNDLMQLNLSADDVALLAARTEGWVAGLQLAALSMQGQQDRSTFVASFAGDDHFIADYLIEEVLDQQSAELRMFLLQTSILTRMNASLCNAVTGRTDSQTLLESLQQANLFIVPLDSQRRWYRYHHLFAALLRHRLQISAQGQLKGLHRQAAVWYAQAGIIAEAITHSLAAADLERAARLIEMHSQALIKRGEFTTGLGWLAALPDEMVRTRPWLAIYNAWFLRFTTQTERVEPHLHNAESAIRTMRGDDCARTALSKAETSVMQGHIAAIRAFIARDQRELAHSINLCHQALEQLPLNNLFLRALVLVNLGVAYFYLGDLNIADQTLQEAEQVGWRADIAAPVVGALHLRAQSKLLQGKLTQAIALCEQALDVAAERGWSNATSAILARTVMGELLRERNDLPAATRHLTEAIDRSQLATQPAAGISYLLLARVQQAQRRVADSFQSLHAAAQIRRKYDFDRFFPIHSSFEICQVQLWLAQNNLAAAFDWVVKCGSGIDDELTLAHEIDYLMLARVLIVQSREEPKPVLEPPLRLLTRLQESAIAGRRTGRVIEIRILQAIAYEAQGDIEARWRC